jgi:hypothetical protein
MSAGYVHANEVDLYRAKDSQPVIYTVDYGPGDGSQQLRPS